ncbi:type IV toxin-antitoxin system AbiEi family antitoxin domain-containing protein [Vagococcus zengguangii]|uniref:Uncharacterized protein n=1 Tax=Vagococcus zengguangii TaxID=2571750 RepID=A0A4D7CQF8_9ENTE|nr:hypothetical protein [Vagococcus zengguangii]QCI86328.1 hypothetical protein FA707_04825 [Vagococcus zengguangii]
MDNEKLKHKLLRQLGTLTLSTEELNQLEAMYRQFVINDTLNVGSTKSIKKLILNELFKNKDIRRVCGDFFQNKDYFNKADLVQLFSMIASSKVGKYELFDSNYYSVELESVIESYSDKLLTEYGFEKVRNGWYKNQDSPEDDEFEIQIYYPNMIFSHESALYYHELTNVIPKKYITTVPRTYNNSNTRYGKLLKIVRTSKFISNDDVVIMKTNYQNEIRVTSIYRTICDVMNPKYKMNAEIRNRLLVESLKRNDVNITKLLNKAKEQNVEHIIRPLIEVLAQSMIE